MQRSTAGVILMVALLAGCGQATSTTTSPAPTSASVAPPIPSAVATTAEPTQSSPTAADDFAAFIAAAEATDRALSAAETTIGTLVTQPDFVVDQRVVDQVTAIPSLTDMWLALPPGAPDPLLDAAVRVASGLNVRKAALDWFAHPWSSDDVAADGELSMPLDCLEHGSVPAAGFADDVDALLAQATAAPPVRSVAPDGTEALRISVIAEWLQGRNTTSLACGDVRTYGVMPVVTWTVAPGEGEPVTGTVDGVDFVATIPADPARRSVGTDRDIDIFAG